MPSEGISYDAFQECRFPNQRLIRQLGDWQILSSSGDGHFRLLLISEPTKEVIVCNYRTAFERQHDIEILKRASEGSRPLRDVSRILKVESSPSTPSKPPPPTSPPPNSLPSPGIG